ncbi:MAG: carboxypeptidase Y-deficient [Thelocarpon superellum]|nr:MAG: carboxypeptidase Y-deficient [Thelocarpon superellum]
MASPRKLGGGRVLGTGRSLSPAIAAAATAKRSSSLISPSVSSVSLSSQVSTDTSTEAQDLSSRVSLDRGDPAAADVSTAHSRLVCPICNEDMVTLLQLNRHLDDDHQNLEEVEQDEVKSWFKTQMIKAKRFQPLAVLNQKLKGLDAFEPNEVTVGPTAPTKTSTAPAEVSRPDPDEVVTRAHWQRSTGNDLCGEPMCGRSLNVVNGNVNCRKCGKLFCEDHTMYQMKLSRSAQHEPVRGFWCRTCETCYKSREGYNDHHGVCKDHSSTFTALRRKNVDKAYLDVTRLEKRLTKLTRLLTQSVEENGAGAGSVLWPLSGPKSPRKMLEQSVVTWEDDASVAKCPFCQQEFSNYAFRRHHCRLCGRVVCGDPRTGCSTEVGLDITANTNSHTEKDSTHVSVDVRMCRDCHKIVFGRRDFAQASAARPPAVKAYETLVQFERGIRLMLPKFQQLLTALQDPKHVPSPTQLSEASKVRRRLMESFSKYDAAARRLRDLPSTSSTQQRLQKAIYQKSTNFLHLHMLPLRALPKVLNHAAPPNGHAPSPLTPRTNGRRSLLGIKGQDVESTASSNISSTSSGTISIAAVSALEAEEKELRDRLIVLEEQQFFVHEMIADANKRRKFDEVGALAQNEDDLRREIRVVEGQLARLDFAGAYTAGPAAGDMVVT